MSERFDLHALSSLSPEALREALLGPTLERAARIPYYRGRWGARWLGVRTVRDLTRLPLLTKAEATRHQESLRASGAGEQAGVISSGTQSGELRPLRVFRDPREAEVLAAFEASRLRTDSRGRGGFRVLEVRSVHHGFPVDRVASGRERLLWSHDAGSFARVEAQLRRRTRRAPRFGGLVIGSGALMPLTLHLLARGEEPAAFGLTAIGTTSFRLTAHWRAFVERTWGARVYDNYSLSEFTSYALECERCGFGHWRGPPLVAELLDPHTRRPVQGGVGALVLTGLFPFVQAMPLVRYVTGDLVELGPPCSEAASDRGVRWRGRVSQSLFSPRGSLWIAGGDVVEELERLAEVARSPHPAEALGLVDSVDCGPVKYELARAGAGARLTVEVRFDPAAFERRARAIARALERAIRRRSGTLGRVPLHVSLVRPGTLTAPWSKW